MSGRVCVAQFGAAHGVRGELRLRSFTENPADVTAYGPLETEDGRQRFEIEALRPGNDHFVVRIKGVADRNAAERLTNLKLFVSRDRLPEPEEGEFYHADLIGLEAFGEDGTPLGTVTGVHNFGAGDMIEIAPVGGGDTLLVPFSDAAVPAIDLTARRMVVIPPVLTE